MSDSDNVHLGHRARKRFGQNFLQDQNVINSIIRAINPQPDDILVEIGPGLGALTEPMLAQCEHLTVVELDRDLAERLINHPTMSHKLTVHQADAMKFDFGSLIQPGKSLKVFGNLPYNVSTPLLFHLFDYSEHIASMHFMLQKEVVERMVAAPNSKDFGRLSVMTQYYCHPIPVIEVGPQAFIPAPKVDSAVVRLIPKKADEKHASCVKTLNQVCLEAFNMRRKTVRNCFKNLATAEQLEALGINPGLRPENLALEQFVALANFVYQQRAQ